ncbi:MAG: 1-acyl-sn-glycerol-3-phosphate acyltransferase [Spirochaetes bacterium]|nr:1-acyl-sn-glycerol-3-phosphate acyltransferase [Spirochaetota bacterium]
MKGKKRHDFVYRMSWILFRRFFARKFNFEYDAIRPEKSPFFVISNHLTNWDPILIGLSFGRNLYYVATDQIFRMGLKSRILKFLFSPIPLSKTVQETQTVISIFRRLKDNCNICIFAEGSTSFDGETGEIQPSIAKLIKRAGATLVTYRFTGSYFTLPRWARFISKGKMEGRLVQIYSPERISAMSTEEIFEAIKSDINVSAYDIQEKNMTVFRGKKRAEYLETVLYCCPKCRQFASLKSHDDTLSCKCGFKVRFNEYGFFEIPEKTEEPPFKTITAWAKWQKREIETLAGNSGGNTPIFTDGNQRLFKVDSADHDTFIAEGRLCLYKDRLSLTSSNGKEFVFPLAEIIDMSCFAMMRILFSFKERKIWEIHSKHPRSALKYIDFFNEVNKHKE